MAIQTPNTEYQEKDGVVYEKITLFRTAISFGELKVEQKGRSEAARDAVNKWRRTEEGRWCESRGICLQTYQETAYGEQQELVAVRGLLTPSDASFYRLKWGK